MVHVAPVEPLPEAQGDEQAGPHTERQQRDEELPAKGLSLEALFNEFSESIVPNSTQTVHPKFLAYVLSCSNGLAPFAQALASAINQSCSLWQLSPAANVIEQKVVRWFADFFDFPICLLFSISTTVGVQEKESKRISENQVLSV